MSVRPKSYAEAFLKYFDVSFAADQAQIADAGRIRYRVYCEEFGYEPPEAHPDGIEHDEFDKHSLHCLVTHKSTNCSAGCVRVVTALADDQRGLPFEQVCADTLDREFFERNPIPRQSMCEISRLAVDSAFRRRAGESANRFGGAQIIDPSRHEQRTFPLIAVSCYLAAIALSDLTGCNNGFAMMEPFLPRLLARSGVNFTRVGQDIDYHGLRGPYWLTTERAVEDMVPELKELYDAIHSSVKKDYKPG